ncbi:MAG: hypothetical protein K6E51_04340 [Treponema sp.]|nr:hypothetical protein [Treponema sp.]
MKYIFITIITVLYITFPTFAQSHISKQPHQSAVTTINTSPSSEVFSTANDGFVIKWTDDGLGEHYQISDMAISMTAISPKGNAIAIYESDGTTNKVSVWDWSTLTKKYTVQFKTPLTLLTYSEKGTYLIAGTASMTGLVFLQADSGRMISNKVKENPGIVTMATTSATENTAVTYSPAGTLSYFNLKTGLLKQKFNMQPSLTDTLLFHNNLMLAGRNGNELYIVQATTGTTLTKMICQTPVIVSSKNDDDLYYLTSDGRQYTLNKLAIVNSKPVKQPEIVKIFPQISAEAKITCGVKCNNTIYLGSSTGSIHSINLSEESDNMKIATLTDSTYQKVLDVVTVNDEFYFLTKKNLCKSSYDNNTIQYITDNSGYTNIVSHGQNIILWTKNSRNSVAYFDIAQKKLTTLFTPNNGIKTLRLFGNTILYIENNTTIYSYSLDTMHKEMLYSGVGLEDLLLYNDTDLYVAKSAATSPNSPLIYIDTQTKETVALPLQGTVAYSLHHDATTSDDKIYGILISADTSNGSTTVFSYSPSTKKDSTLIKVYEEDSDSFINLNNNQLYTNIGKNQISAYNIGTKKTINYKRSAAIPSKVERNSKYMIVVNKDGSITWYNINNQTPLTDWYLTTTGEWAEF